MDPCGVSCSVFLSVFFLFFKYEDVFAQFSLDHITLQVEENLLSCEICLFYTILWILECFDLCFEAEPS